MDDLLARRLAHHGLGDPAPDVVTAARRMLATQAQELWGGRWGLTVRTATGTGADVDAALDAGRLVRSWPMRGTLHLVPAEDLHWVLGVTAGRMRAKVRARHAELQIDAAGLTRAGDVLREALADGGLTRAEVMERWQDAGIVTEGQRGVHLIGALATDGLVCWGPVVPHPDGRAAPREQRLVLTDRWITERTDPTDPAAELFVRFVRGHGPAGVEDFVWWTGLTLTAARAAAAGAADRLVELSPGRWVHPDVPDTAPDTGPDADTVHALPSFDEYYLSYADRSPVADDDRRAAVGPGRNGMVKAVLVHRGRVVGTWRRADGSVTELGRWTGAVRQQAAAALEAFGRRG